MGKGRKYKIVYIEDDEGMVDLMRFILDREELEFIGITEGQRGLEVMREIEPDLLLLDLMLPDMAGWAIYQQMKVDPQLRDIPVIVVTARGTSVDRVLGERVAKVQAYVTKPFNPTQLVEQVYRVLGLELRKSSL